MWGEGMELRHRKTLHKALSPTHITRHYRNVFAHQITTGHVRPAWDANGAGSDGSMRVCGGPPTPPTVATFAGSRLPATGRSWEAWDVSAQKELSPPLLGYLPRIRALPEVSADTSASLTCASLTGIGNAKKRAPQVVSCRCVRRPSFTSNREKPLAATPDGH